MRKTTTAIVGVAGASAIWASWQAGLAPEHPAPTAVAIVGPPAPSTTSVRASGPSAARASAAKGSKPAGTTRHTVQVDGAVVSTPFGDVQVRLTHVGSTITDIHALHLTDSSQHSASISAYAAPILRREAIAAQSAQIDMVSGATYTSEAYQQSLQAAIDAAHL